MVILTILVLILVLAFEPARELLFGLIGLVLYAAFLLVVMTLLAFLFALA
jgi:hypothetical protein